MNPISMRRPMGKAVGLALVLGFPAVPGADAALDPATYSSASGEYALSVDPSDIDGRGPADCRFSRNGETVWTNRFPFTFWEAVVADSGTVAGYAYGQGRRGNYGAEGHGDLRVVVLSPDGAILGQESVARTNSIFFGEDPPRPCAEGIFQTGPPPLAIVRVVEPAGREEKEFWWVYDLATGARVATQDPRAQMSDAGTLQAVLSATPLPGLSLNLVHWLAIDYPRRGAAFALLNLLGEPVWELSLPTDYTCPDDDKREDEILRSIRRNGAVLAIGTNGTFDLQFVQDNLRVSYAVEQTAPRQWTIRETARASHALAPADVPPVPPPAAPLEKLGEFPLQTPAAASNAVRDVEAFDFDPEGRICALKDPRGVPALLYLAQTGEVLAEIQLPTGEKTDYPSFAGPASIGGQRFVVGYSPTVNTTRWFLADFEKGEVRLIAEVGDSRADACAGFPDGRFAALTTRHLQYTTSRGLSGFDADGKLLWNRDDDAGYSNDSEEFLSPEDLAVVGTNRIAVLDNIRNTLQLFDDGGDFRRILDFDDIWDRKPNYPTDVAPDADGGFIVFDFNAPETLLRLNPDGAIRSASSPRLADGRPFRVYDGVKRSPQGDLWTCDGQSLIRLATNSVADLVLGYAPDASVLSEPGLARIGPGARVYVADSRSRAVHVFDSAGQRLHACIPDPADMDETAYVSHLAFAPDGGVFVSLGPAPGYLRFDENGRRLGRVPVAAERGRPPLYFQPTGTRCWAVGRHDLYLLDGLSNELRRIARKADGKWLDDPGLAAVAPDGSIAIHGAGSTINVYDADGNARATFAYPVYPRVSRWSGFAPPAFDGRRVYVRANNLLSVFDAAGAPAGVFSFGAEAETERWDGPFLAAKGRELWFIAPQDLTVHRFAAP
ncbi:MAG: hypothetical protein AB7V14_00390 [Kiritimatiellia bacterium]